MFEQCQDDLLLVNDVKEGKRISEESLYNKYKEIVYDYLVVKYPKNLQIDDDVSEILIKVFTSISTYNHDKSKFKTWVITIVKNYMIDKIRNSKYNSVVEYNTECYCNSTYSEESNDFSESAISIISDKLEVTDYTLLDMHYEQGYSYSEIGSEFNVTSSTVSNRVNYIKSKLKDSISKEIIYE